MPKKLKTQMGYVLWNIVKTLGVLSGPCLFLQEEEAEDPTEGEPVDEEDEEGWMVPHGYLSDSENEGEVMDIETVKLREKEFYKSLKDQIKVSTTRRLGIGTSVYPVVDTYRLLFFSL